MFVVKRSAKNPVLLPVRKHTWEAFAAYNWCPIDIAGSTHVVYRAVALPQSLKPEEKDLYVSTIGHAVIDTDLQIHDRRPLIAPEYDWERFGCEDPRITKIEDTYYITYTALSVFPFAAPGIKLAVATTKDLKTIDDRHLATPFNAKAMVLFPEKIAGKYIAMLTVNPDLPPSSIGIARFDSTEDMWSPEFWNNWHTNLKENIFDPRRNDSEHCEIGAPPIKTDRGWLLVYSHIKNYFTEKKIFGIEALLLDINNPQQIIGRTTDPLLIPDEVYERYGRVPNIVFPTGAQIKDNRLKIFYGGADTNCCICEVDLNRLLDSMQPSIADRFVTRFEKNPIIRPVVEHPWEAKATYNPAAIDIDGKIHILYRAQSADNTSCVGYASSEDGFHITERLPDSIYYPREEFESKRIPGGMSGCEDPRIVRIDDRVYMCYTIYDGIHVPRVALTSIHVQDFLAKKWNWSKPQPLTPEGIDDKDTCIFPEKINGKYLVLHRVDSHVCADFLDTLEGTDARVDRCIQLFGPRPGMWDTAKVGIASPPVRTEKGWLLFYHGVSSVGIYRVGAVLMDLHNPLAVLARTSYWLMEPEADYEKFGQIPNVAFPCGTVIRDDTVFLYYGGADSVVGVATLSLKKILDMME